MTCKEASESSLAYYLMKTANYQKPAMNQEAGPPTDYSADPINLEFSSI